MADLPGDREGLLVKLGSGLVIAPEPGAFAEVAPHGRGGAPVAERLGQYTELRAGFLGLSEPGLRAQRFAQTFLPFQTFCLQLLFVFELRQQTERLAEIIDGGRWGVARAGLLAGAAIPIGGF